MTPEEEKRRATDWQGIAERLADVVENMLLCIGSGSIKSFKIRNDGNNTEWLWHDEWASEAQENLAEYKKAKGE